MSVASVCQRCGRKWRPWAVSSIPVHAECYFAPALQDDLLELKLRFPQVTIARLARDFGVTAGVMRSSLAAAMKRRGMKVPSLSRA